MITEQALVRVNGLSKSYGSGAEAVSVLMQIDLEVYRGECLYLVGPSGSGKTTLLSILGCVLSADQGMVQILGQETTQLSPNQRTRFRREHLGFVFQRFHLFDALTAHENVCMPLTLLKRPPHEASERAHALLKMVGLQEKAQRRTNQLSMGQRQRVALARALAGDPALILADEPTASLDADSGMQAMELLKGLCQSLGKTVVVVTHDSRIYGLADRILHLAEGRLVNRPTVDSMFRARSSLGENELDRSTASGRE